MLALRRSILTEKVSRRGYHLSREYATDPLEILFARVISIASWLEDLTRSLASRDDDDRFTGEPDDASTLRSVVAIRDELSSLSPEAQMGKVMAESLLGACDEDGRLPVGRRQEAAQLIALIEARLA